MRRSVSARITATVSEPAELIFAVAAAGAAAAGETLVATVDGDPVPVREIADRHGGRLHVVDPGPIGAFELTYRADVDPVPLDERGEDRYEYLRPSRYAEHDRLAPVAGAILGEEKQGRELADAVVAWVGSHLAYVTGYGRVTDGAVDTYLSRQGVCRDFAHLVIALLRARNVPARLAAVYAPGLSPMDFHAVAEAWFDDGWHVLDATGLAPRASMVRISTGRDAADTAFMTVQTGRAQLHDVVVGATVAGDLPLDDPTAPIRLA